MALIQAHSCLLWGKIKILAIVTFIKGGYTMPSSNEILSGLTFSANMFRPFAIIWHLIFFALIVALLTRWKPSNRLFAMLFSLPLLSVSFFAWLTNNYFNGFVFLLASIISFTTAFKINEHPISGGMRWSSVSGSLLILFGLVYPEFLHAYSPLEYIYASPVGLIPCPTLSVITGFALIFFNNESRLWMLLLFTVGLFYGIFGLFRLHVIPDTIMLVGSLILFFKLLVTKKNTAG